MPVLLAACAFMLRRRPARRTNIQAAPSRSSAPHPPGIATDVLGRALAATLQHSLGQPVIVENRPGANGIVADGVIAKAPADGYTLLITTGAHIANAFVDQDPALRRAEGFRAGDAAGASYGLGAGHQPAGQLGRRADCAGEVEAGQADLRDQRRRQHHPRCRPSVRARTGTEMVAVPYNTPNLTTDVMAGTVDMTFYLDRRRRPAGYRRQAQGAGGHRLAPLADAARTRRPCRSSATRISTSPAGSACCSRPALRRDRIDRIHQESRKALDAPELTRVINAAGMYVVGSSPAEFAAFLQQDYDYQDKLMTELGLKVR